ncbi:unnamed protein product, partial [Ectocarpus sp. 13 AM-2016]
TPFSFSFFSTLHGGSSIAAHTAPCNLRLRCHLPLTVPSTDPSQCGMLREERCSEGTSCTWRRAQLCEPCDEKQPLRVNVVAKYNGICPSSASSPACSLPDSDFVSVIALVWSPACCASIKAGKCLVFDDCYEHEVWNKTERERVLLLFDLWHPDLAGEVRLSSTKRIDC